MILLTYVFFVCKKKRKNKHIHTLLVDGKESTHQNRNVVVYHLLIENKSVNK